MQISLACALSVGSPFTMTYLDVLRLLSSRHRAYAGGSKIAFRLPAHSLLAQRSVIDTIRVSELRQRSICKIRNDLALGTYPVS